MSTDPDINELEALKALIESDGWALYQAHLEREWGPAAYAQRIDTAMASAKAARESAEQDLYELGAAARAVRIFASWPVKRIQDLRTKVEKPAGVFGRRRA